MGYSLSDGKVLAIGGCIGSGSRGEIFALEGDPDIAVKIFEPTYRTPGREGKISIMSDCTNRAEGVAWPLGKVFEDGEFAGFTMHRYRGRTLSRLAKSPDCSVSFRASIAREICDIVCRVHDEGMVVSDLALANFMLLDDGMTVVLLDADAFQVDDAAQLKTYSATESHERSPEMYAMGTLGSRRLTEVDDAYMLSIAVFILLFGQHPLDSGASDVDSSEERRSNAVGRQFAYAARADALPLSIVGPGLEKLFWRTFTAEDTSSRPTCEDYRDALASVLVARFALCLSCSQEYPSMLSACPMCGHAAGPGSAPAPDGVPSEIGRGVRVAASALKLAAASMARSIGRAVRAITGICAAAERAAERLASAAASVLAASMRSVLRAAPRLFGFFDGVSTLVALPLSALTAAASCADILAALAQGAPGMPAASVAGVGVSGTVLIVSAAILTAALWGRRRKGIPFSCLVSVAAVLLLVPSASACVLGLPESIPALASASSCLLSGWGQVM